MSAHLVWLDLDLLCRRRLRTQVTSKIISGPKSNATNASDVRLTNTMGDGLNPDGSVALKINTSGDYGNAALANTSTTYRSGKHFGLLIFISHLKINYSF